MKQFEKCLKTLLAAYNVECIPLYCPDFPDIKESDFRFLSALNLISLEPGGDDTFYIIPSESGLTYFHRKREDRRRFWKEHIIYFLCGFISGVLTTILATAILRWLL